jgi:dCTP deaminase
MAVMPDKWIIRMAKEHGLIEPFAESQVRREVISFGVSSYGYDFRLANEFKVFAPKGDQFVIDPKSLDQSLFVSHKGDHCLIPPHGLAIVRSIEYFRIPRNIITICFGKSTYSRCGIMVNVTPFEPEWEGHVTFSVINLTPSPAKIYANEGIAQVLFLKAESVCDISYKDKKGKYQGSRGITHSKIEQ